MLVAADGAKDDEDVSSARADFQQIDNTIENPKTISQALEDESWVEAMQEELLQFKLQKVWILIDLPFRKKAIGTKWVFRNKRDKRSIVVKNKARLVAQAFHLFNALGFFLSTKWMLRVHFLYGTIEEESMYTEFEDCMNKRFQMSFMGELTFFLGLQVKQQPDGIFISQDKFQVTPKASHLNAVKRIFRYLKHQPKLGLWYPRDSPFELEAFSDSDYGGASLDRKSTTGGCQFLGRRLISWQCKKQTIMANSTTKAEYVAAANCCGQIEATYGAELVVLCGAWVQARLANFDGCQANLVLSGKFDAARQIWCCQANLVLPGKISMANLEFFDQHNMVTYLEKIERNSDFHEIVDFLASSSIYHALTVSPPIYTSYIEQFWNTASSQTVNDVKQINATVDSMSVVVTEASIRSSLLFNDANAEGEGSGEPTEPQPTPSPTQPSTGDQPPKTSSSHATTQDSRDSLEGTNGNEGDQVQIPHDSPLSGGHTSDRAEGALNLQELSVLCTNLSNRVLALESIKDAQAAEISALKSRIKKLEKKCKPSISHHRAWLKSVNRLSIKKRFRKKEYVSKQGRKKSKPELTLDDSIVFDDQDADHVVEDKGSGDKGGNVEELVSTARPEVCTARPDIDATRQEDSAVEPRTPPITTSIFNDEDITMAQTLIKMKEEKSKEKGVSIKDVDDSSRPARSILTLMPLKYKGKGVLKESPVKKVKRSDLDAAQIAKDVEIARLVHEKELAGMEREKEERQRQDQASVDYIASLYDEVPAKMDASEELAARLQIKEREMYTIEERSKLLAEFFEKGKKLLTEERAAAVRNKPPTRTQLRSLMMTYLKHTAGMDEEEVPEEPESTKVEVKQEGREENIRKRSGRRLKMKATKKSKRQKTDSDLEEEEQLRASLKIVPDEEEEIDYEVLGTRYPIVNWESAFYHTHRYGVPHNYYRVFKANGSLRYINTFTEMVSRFDRLDFIELHNDDIWKNQEKWIIKNWTFYENYGVHILALEDDTKIHMLAERRYPLIRETLERMMELRLNVESEGKAVFDLLRFIQKQIDVFGGQDGSEKDL
ncbi:putative ribonuclease H-like domain-containing protein [Tanacetum coccineum]|uniref:Ribonuclease H-like domain-containing protein n=1 Tax=Tanacetum coccineum TaxID=301880 RepID=A0ABQ4XGP1_9ASTR